MADADDIDRLREIAGRFFELHEFTILGKASAPFDVSKPNFHDTKAEFLKEVEYVEISLKHISKLADLMRAAYRDDDALQGVSRNVSKWVDAQAHLNVVKRRIEYPSDLVVQGAVSIGLTMTTLFLLLENLINLNARKQELESQRDIFWKGSGRAPNHYARTIALRFAKLIAKNTGKKPTFGTSRDGSHPSTEFGRALEEIFEILQVDATVKHPATWAIKQITDEDLKPETLGLLGSLLNPRVQPHHPQNALARLAATMTKPEEQ